MSVNNFQRMSPNPIKTQFEKKLIELGYTYQCNTDDFYILYQNNNSDWNIKVQLICSEPIDDLIHGSHNGNAIQSIGYFKLRLFTEEKSPDFIILAFQNSISNSAEFIIIPYGEFKRRIIKRNRVSIVHQKFEMVFWLMPDNYLYETKDISTEAEWYYMSKGINGRMADGSVWDYTDYHNDWGNMKVNNK